MAWSVILLSFTLFCVICAVTTIGVQWFFFESTVSLGVTLQPGKGTTTLQGNAGGEIPVRTSRIIQIGESIETETTVERSQTSLIFQDQARFVGMVTLGESTVLNLRNASRPRFQWGSDNYQIDLLNVIGEVDVRIPEDLSRDIEVNIYSPNGTWVRLGASGQYTVNASTDMISVSNWSGEAILVVPDSTIQPRSIPQGQRGVVAADATTIDVVDASVNLLLNNTLTIFDGEESEDEDGMFGVSMVGWACSHEPLNSGPRGELVEGVSPDGQNALRLLRVGATATGRTGCNQSLGDPEFGLDVTRFKTLELRITMFIQHQSVPLCGIVGSECPLMIRVIYVTEDGVTREWFHGVYAERNDSYPLLCTSCFQPHVLIQKEAWYIYESNNLFDLLQQPGSSPEDDPIGLQAIKNIRFYASGHEYDVFLTDVSLLASQSPVNSNVASSTPDG